MPQNDTAMTLIGGDKVDKTSEYRDALSVNMVSVLKQILGASGYLIMHSGLKLFATGKGIDRGGIWNERLLAHVRVSGQKLVTIDGGGSVIEIGDVDGLDFVSLPYSFNTQGILANKKFYLWNEDIGLLQITDPDLGEPIDCVWVDGYYFFTDGEYLFHNNLEDDPPTDPSDFIDPLRYATAEYSPDPTYGVGRTVDNKVITFGRYSTEYFSNVGGNAQFRFTRIKGRSIKTGIVGTHCKCEMNNTWYILGGKKEEDIAVHVIGVGNSEKVSSRHIDKIIKQYTEQELREVTMEARVENDQHFVIVHLPRETLMFNHDIAKNMGLDDAWTVLKSDKGNNQWRGRFGIFEPRLGKWLYGDKQNASIGILDDTITTEYGTLVEYLMFTPFVDIEGMSIDELEIETVSGFTAKKDATVAISLTYDGEHYSKEHWVNYGDPSEYGKRFIARRLGYVRQWFSLKMRIVSRSRMAFSFFKMKYS